MEPEVWIPIITAVAGAVLGWLSTVLTFRREWRRELTRLKIDTYAEWCAGMEKRLAQYASSSAIEFDWDSFSRCQQRLLLIESDPKARQLVQDVENSIPVFDSEEYHELVGIINSCPDWEWAPFRNKMNELQEHVKMLISRLKV